MYQKISPAGHPPFWPQWSYIIFKEDLTGVRTFCRQYCTSRRVHKNSSHKPFIFCSLSDAGKYQDEQMTFLLSLTWICTSHFSWPANTDKFPTFDFQRCETKARYSSVFTCYMPVKPNRFLPKWKKPLYGVSMSNTSACKSFNRRHL